MPALRLLVQWTTRTLMRVLASAITVAGICLIGMSATTGVIGIEWEGLPALATGLALMGSALACAGGVAIVRGRRDDDADERLDGSTGRVGLVLLVAAVLPVLLVWQLSPLLAYWRDVAALGDRYDGWSSANGPSGLLLVPAAGVLLVPGVEVIGAVAAVLTCACVLLLALSGSGCVRKVSAAGAILTAGLCVASGLGAWTTERLAPGVETAIRTTAKPVAEERGLALALLARQRSVSSESARTLGWAALAMIGLAAGTSSIPRARMAARGPGQTSTREQALLDAAEQLHRSQGRS